VLWPSQLHPTRLAAREESELIDGEQFEAVPAPERCCDRSPMPSSSIPLSRHTMLSRRGGGSTTAKVSPSLFDQIDAEMVSLTADGAYVVEVVYEAVADRDLGDDNHHSAVGDVGSE
jgi:hypothetical protein